jgi:hypothetical protein
MSMSLQLHQAGRHIRRWRSETLPNKRLVTGRRVRVRVMGVVHVAAVRHGLLLGRVNRCSWVLRLRLAGRITSATAGHVLLTGNR